MLENIIRKSDVIICCGCGGVGKTTTSAAIGILAAMQGRTTMVLTVDPAKRLADSLGIGSLSNSPKRVPLPKGVPGRLDAMMMDVKETLDNLIKQNASNPEQVQKILKNHIYQQLSQQNGGGQEYGAMESLFQIHVQDEYDLIVLDTPPSQHSIDFIMAPMRLQEFFSQSVLRFFLNDSAESTPSTGTSILNKGKNITLKILQKLTGADFVNNLADFLENFQDMYDSIQRQAEHVTDLLTSPKTSFVIICGPEDQQVQETVQLMQKLREFRIYIKGVVINRCAAEFVFTLERQTPLRLKHELEHLVAQNYRQIDFERGIQEQILPFCDPATQFIRIPTFPKDIHSVDNLLEFSKYLASF